MGTFLGFSVPLVSLDNGSLASYLFITATKYIKQFEEMVYLAYRLRGSPIVMREESQRAINGCGDTWTIIT